MPVHPAAAAVFGDRLQLAERYVDALATAGVERGLLGPREVDRLWDRHVLNCAVIAELLPYGARVVDVGSGAGLPGLAIAIKRPDVSVDLVESLERRTDFLTEVVGELRLESSVRVVRGRAEDPGVRAVVGGSQWVTARAVAPLDRLVRWCLPLLDSGGALLAIKGERALAEATKFEDAVSRLGGDKPVIVRCGDSELAQATTVVVVRRMPMQGRRDRKVNR